MPDNLFDLSTSVVPADTFTVDGGEQYQLLGLEHLTPADEITVTAGFARFQNLARQLDEASTQAKAESFAKAMRSQRIKLLSQMTTCPIEVLNTLPMKAQITLMDAIGEQFTGEPEPEEDIEA